MHTDRNEDSSRLNDDDGSDEPVYRSLDMSQMQSMGAPRFRDFQTGAADPQASIAPQTFEPGQEPVYRSINAVAPPAVPSQNYGRQPGTFYDMSAHVVQSTFGDKIRLDAAAATGMGMGATISAGMAPPAKLGRGHPGLAAGSVSAASAIDESCEGTVSVPRVPPPPFPIEFTHFRSKADHTHIADEINAFLKGKPEMSLAFTAGKAKWKGLFTENYYTVAFRVRLFTDRHELRRDQTIVELQRRSGSVMVFANLFRELRLCLAAKNMCCRESGDVLNAASLGQQRSFAAQQAALPPLEGYVPPTHDQLVEGLQPLYAMATSQDFEMALEAVRSIAQMSPVEENAAAIEAKGFLPVLQRLMQQVEHHDVRRVASSAVANLSDHVDLASKASIVNTDMMRTLLRNVADVADLTTQRACAKALANLAAEGDQNVNTILEAMGGREAAVALQTTVRFEDPFLQTKMTDVFRSCGCY